jgi:hypothetical protein
MKIKLKLEAVLVAGACALGLLAANAQADGAFTGETYTQTKCVSDNGCYINPFTPNKQYWTYTYGYYIGDLGNRHTHLISSGESGGCCG